MTETHIDDALEVVGRLRKQIKAQIIQHQGRTIRVTMSFGVAALDQASNLSLEQLVDLADKALYVSKRQGRDLDAKENGPGLDHGNSRSGD